MMVYFLQFQTESFMKITANQNLIPYFQPRRDAFPAEQPDEKYNPALNRRTVSDDSLQPKEQTHRYYIKENLENSIYNATKNMIPQSGKSKGILIDIFA
jgi:hypothetical protein